MTTIKTSELTGAALDWAVAEAEEVSVDAGAQVIALHGAPVHRLSRLKFSPSTDWSRGGPLIEERKVHLIEYGIGWAVPWVMEGEIDDFLPSGPTPLIAACRAIVAAKLGDEVDVPEEVV